jgi:hypothetical protein
MQVVRLDSEALHVDEYAYVLLLSKTLQTEFIEIYFKNNPVCEWLLVSTYGHEGLPLFRVEKGLNCIEHCLNPLITPLASKLHPFELFLYVIAVVRRKY